LTNRETIELFDAEVAASEATLSRAKNVGKSAQEDLKQHERWLRRHAAAEAKNRDKHHRRLKRLKISQRRWVKRQRLLRSVRQRATIVNAAARSVAVAAGGKTVSAANYSRDRLSAAVAWSSPRLQAATSASYRAGNAGYAWLKVKAGQMAVQLSEAGKIAAENGYALTRKLSKRGAAGFAALGVKSRELASQLSERGSSAFAWSRVKGDALRHSAGNVASIGVAHAKRKTGSLAQSASKLTAAAAGYAHTYGSQALTLASSWLAKARANAERLRASPSTGDLAENAEMPPARPEDTSAAGATLEPVTLIEFPDRASEREAPAQAHPVAEEVTAPPKALAASALSKPAAAPRAKPKPDKIKATDKTHRGGRGGKKKRKQRGKKSESK
jgi:hypothetical protein